MFFRCSRIKEPVDMDEAVREDAFEFLLQVLILFEFFDHIPEILHGQMQGSGGFSGFPVKDNEQHFLFIAVGEIVEEPVLLRQQAGSASILEQLKFGVFYEAVIETA